MNVLVGYASEHGSTAGIAERIAQDLRNDGIAAKTMRLHDVTDMACYDAFVLGSAIHDGRWLPEASVFMNRDGGEVDGRPAWLFSVSSLGDQSSMFGSRPSRLLRRLRKPSPQLLGFAATVDARDHHNFAGAIERSDYGIAGRLFMRLFGGRFGDHRNWDEVDAWARQITKSLAATTPVAAVA